MLRLSYLLKSGEEKCVSEQFMCYIHVAHKLFWTNVLPTLFGSYEEMLGKMKPIFPLHFSTSKITLTFRFGPAVMMTAKKSNWFKSFTFYKMNLISQVSTISNTQTVSVNPCFFSCRVHTVNKNGFWPNFPQCWCFLFSVAYLGQSRNQIVCTETFLTFAILN